MFVVRENPRVYHQGMDYQGVFDAVREIKAAGCVPPPKNHLLPRVQKCCVPSRVGFKVIVGK